MKKSFSQKQVMLISDKVMNKITPSMLLLSKCRQTCPNYKAQIEIALQALNELINWIRSLKEDR